MRNPILLLSILCILFSVPTLAQWTTDPSNPFVVSQQANRQSDVQSFPDGSGGLYIFWRDSRVTSNDFDIYAQHISSDGTALWEDGGREIVNGNGNVWSFHPMRTTDGKIFIAWTVLGTQEENGAYMQRLDPQGASMWSEVVQLKTGSSQLVHLVESAGVYYAGMQGTVIGGASTIYINKFLDDGTLQWPFDEYNIVNPSPAGIGGSYITSDETGGIYVYYSNGNGSGAHMYCNHIGGDVMNSYWSSWKDVLASSTGLYGNFSGISDSNGITFCWIGTGPEGTGTNLYARRLNPLTGTFAWADTTRTICAADGAQARFFWKRSGNQYFITWSDSRPGVVGNSAIYARSFDTFGIVYWQEDGVEVADLNTYIPYPEFDLDEDNTMMICHQGGSPSNFVAQKILSDGSREWGPLGTLVFINTYAPFYEDFNIVYLPGRFVAISGDSQPGGGADGVYMAEIILQVTTIEQSEIACNSFTQDGVTYEESGTYTIDISPDSVLILDLTIIPGVAEVTPVDNSLTTESAGSYQWFNCDTQQPVPGASGPSFVASVSGNYALIINNDFCSDTSACYPLIATGLFDHPLPLQLSIHPNPGQDQLIIDMEELSGQRGSIEIYTVTGQRVSVQALCPDSPCIIPTSDLAAGTYRVEVLGNKGRYSALWMKE